MNDKAACCVLFIGVLLLIYVCKHDIDNFRSKTYVVARDGKQYPVVGSFDGDLEAADLLARINKFLISVIKNMKRKYLIEGHGGEFEKNAVLVLLDKYNPDVLFENNPRGLVNTSYVENKGTSIGFCLREKETGRNLLHGWKLMQFVSLHEISHIITEEYGHGVEFWRNFKFMIGEAIDAGLYYPINYKTYPETYCRVLVQYSPWFDPTL